MCPLYPPVTPVKILFRRSSKQRKEPCSISTVGLYNIIRINNITFGLGHLCPVLNNHSLRQKVPERLIILNKTKITDYLCKETGKKKKEEKMLYISAIFIYHNSLKKK